MKAQTIIAILVPSQNVVLVCAAAVCSHNVIQKSNQIQSFRQANRPCWSVRRVKELRFFVGLTAHFTVQIMTNVPHQSLMAQHIGNHQKGNQPIIIRHSFVEQHYSIQELINVISFHGTPTSTCRRIQVEELKERLGDAARRSCR